MVSPGQYWKRDTLESRETPKPVSKFVQRFDKSEYPELEAQDEYGIYG